MVSEVELLPAAWSGIVGMSYRDFYREYSRRDYSRDPFPRSLLSTS